MISVWRLSGAGDGLCNSLTQFSGTGERKKQISLPCLPFGVTTGRMPGKRSEFVTCSLEKLQKTVLKPKFILPVSFRIKTGSRRESFYWRIQILPGKASGFPLYIMIFLAVITEQKK